MGGADWKRIGTGVVTGGLSELDRAGYGPSAGYAAITGQGGGGGKGGKGGAPAPPNFEAAVEAQARGAHPNQRTPWANSTWTEGPNGQWSQNLSLAPQLQQGANNLMGQIGSQGPVGTGDQARDQAIDAAYLQASSRLDPQWSQRENALRSQLANQGLDMGSEAYSNAMGDLGRSRNDAYTSAMSDAIRQGTAAQAVTFEQNRAAQMAPYQQLAALQGLSGLPGNPGGANYLDAASLGYQGALNQYGTQQAGKNSAMAGLSSFVPLMFGKPPVGGG